MAVMTSQQRADGYAQFLRDLSAVREALACLKAEGRAAFDAADQWASDNAASYNSALPAAFRTAATPAEKARLLAAVLIARFQLGT